MEFELYEIDRDFFKLRSTPFFMNNSIKKTDYGRNYPFGSLAVYQALYIRSADP
jgi:hypothetical protein